MPPALVVTRRRPPAWRRVLALALLAMPVFLALWLRHLRQMRRRLDRRRLVELFREHRLDAQSTVGPDIERLFAIPAREDLTTHGLALALAAASAVLPDIARQTGSPIPLSVDQGAARVRVETYSQEQMAVIIATMLLTVQAVIRRGSQQGLFPEAMAREVQVTLGLMPSQARAREAMRERLEAQGMDARTIQTQLDQATEQAIQRRARVIAATQAVGLTQMGLQQAWEDAVRQGVVAASQITRHWTVTEDPRLCPQCADIPDMNPQGVALNEPFRTPWGAVLTPPAHPACLTGDTFITAASPITATSKRWYEGQVIILGTTHKKFLTCTPNHPILTGNGWVPADFLRKGDSIICSAGQQRIAIGDDDVETEPAMIEEIIDTLHGTGGMTSTEVPIAPEDFHGDGKGSKVAIIGSYRLLRNHLYATFCQPFSHESFQSRGMLPFLLYSERLTTPGFESIRLPTRCSVCGGSLLSPLGRGHLRPLERFGFRLRTQPHSMISQIARDHGTAYSIVPSEEVNRATLAIQVEQLSYIERRNFCGHVYNLQTGNGWYIGNGIITHNCRCSVDYRVHRS